MLKFIINISGSCLFFLLIIFMDGCASKDVARKASKQGDYETSYKIWKKWVDAGYYDRNIELIKILDKTGKTVDYNKIHSMALNAYNHGEKQAAFVLEDLSIRENDLKQAFEWMKRGDFAQSSLHDFQNHLYLIEHYLNSFSQQKYYLELFEELAKENNAKASYSLANFYSNEQSLFYDLKRAEFFYKKSYNMGNDEAGLRLARLYLHSLEREQEGLAILKRLSKKGMAQASYEIGDYLQEHTQKILQKYNDPCITTSFKTPQEFYVKKISLDQLRSLYYKKGIVQWYKKAYDRGYAKGMIKIIGLDIQQNDFHSATNYSQMDAEAMEKFLQQYTNDYQAKNNLAKLYETNPQLGKTDYIESTYLELMEQNETLAQWKLYNYFEKKQPNSQRADAYLQELVMKDFKPAVSKMYLKKISTSSDAKDYIEQLHEEADSGNREAIGDFITLYGNQQAQEIDFFPYLEKECVNEKQNTKSVDMKLADYYLKHNELDKGATIIQFYAQQEYSDAQYKIAKIYGDICVEPMKAHWLKRARDNGSVAADIEYLSMILKGYADGDIEDAVKRLDKYARANNVEAANLLADAYASGIGVAFDPESAKKYYLMLLQNGDNSVYLKIAAMYEQINTQNQYNYNIEKLYQMAIEKNVAHAKVKYAQYLIDKEKITQAKKILLSIDFEKEPTAKVLLYKITGNNSYVRSAKDTNNGVLLLHYAHHIAKYSKSKALLYAFRAHLCNTPSSGKLTYMLMSRINNSRKIHDLYENAKTYPKCTNGY